MSHSRTNASPYERLEERFRRLSALSDASAMLGWDRQTMMPAGGGEARAETMATLAVMRHEILTAPETGELIEAAAAEADGVLDGTGLDTWQSANLAEITRVHRHATAVPADLVDRLHRACSACEAAWREARPRNDFASVLPHMRTVLALTREEAAAKADALGKTPYDALLDQYEPGATADRIATIFARLEAGLPEKLGRVLEAQACSKVEPAAPVAASIATQEAIGRRVMAALGFDFEHGRLDVSAHPFTGGVPADVRLTTRYDETDLQRGLMGVIHETGHGLYEMGLPEAWRAQPVGLARGMTLHESQSLLFEMQLSRSAGFWRWLAPILVHEFGIAHEAADPARLHASAIRVERGLIRVDADEVTYPLHVILRFGLERALLSGDLDAADLPGAWRDGMKRLVGIEPPDDKDGCLQDIHWYDGAIGYFPTYTLGALAAAQLRAAMERDLPDLEDRLAAGGFEAPLSWVRERVHGRASVAGTDGILEAATGAPLSADAFLAHLDKRYLAN